MTTPAPTFVVFRCSHGSSSTFLPNGKRITFIAGKYATKDAEEIAFLDSLAAHSYEIRRGTAEDAIGLTEGDPLAQLKAKFFAEFMADKERITAELTQGKDLGESVTGPVNAGSTKSIQAVTANR